MTEDLRRTEIARQLMDLMQRYPGAVQWNGSALDDGRSEEEDATAERIDDVAARVDRVCDDVAMNAVRMDLMCGDVQDVEKRVHSLEVFARRHHSSAMEHARRADHAEQELARARNDCRALQGRLEAAMQCIQTLVNALVK